MRGAGSAVACMAWLAGLRVQFLAQENHVRWGPPHGLVESSGVLPHIRKKDYATALQKCGCGAEN